jgi:hypothetical protein
MSDATGVERSLEGLARRLLVVNFAGIHTTANVSHTDHWHRSLHVPLVADCECMQTFTNILYRLLSNPQYVEPLRHDVETAVAEEGWTKAAMDNMHKIDSFLRETQRLDDLDSGPLVYLSEPQLLMHSFFSDDEPSRTSSIHIF